MASFDYNSNALKDFKIEDYIFCSNFDSGNLGRVELKDKLSGEDALVQGFHIEFNTWTTPDCFGTPNESSNRTWFFFSIRGGKPFQNAKINVKNLNRQFKLFSQGMHPVIRIGTAGKWERISGKPEFYNDEEDFVISFIHKPEKPYVEQYYAFTYPFTYTCCQKLLSKYDLKYFKNSEETQNIFDRLSRPNEPQKDKLARRTKIQGATAKGRHDRKSFMNSKSSQVELENSIYYNRELLINSLEGRRVDLLTITSYRGITKQKESCLKYLFPEGPSRRPYLFKDKQIIFLSARVHPGETPASFVLNGFISLLLDSKSSIAQVLRKMYVFKIVPILNPDGVYRGFYRTDTLGQNLNRMYLCPQLHIHPTIYAVKKLIRYLRFNIDGDDSDLTLPPPFTTEESESESGGSTSTSETSSQTKEQNLGTIVQPQNVINAKNVWLSNELNKFVPVGQSECVTTESITQCNKVILLSKESSSIDKSTLENQNNSSNEKNDCVQEHSSSENTCSNGNNQAMPQNETAQNSNNFFLYIDFHGHASKKGIFMYGNHFGNVMDAVECKLLPKLMSLNNSHFHYDSCNFTEKNMYKTEKRDGLSKEGSGRVTVYKVTGLIRSYTLECNYNTGKYVNILPSANSKKNGSTTNIPKYTPHIFEEVGRSLGSSILDITNSNPCSRLQYSEGRSLQGLRAVLRTEVEKQNAVRRSNENRKAQPKNIQIIRRIKRPKGLTSPSPTQKPTKDNKSTKLNKSFTGKNSQLLSSSNTTKTVKSETKLKPAITTSNAQKRDSLSLTINKAISNKLIEVILY